MKSLIFSLLATSSGAALACGFHGALGDGFGALHPRSMAVAFAVQDAVEEKIIEPVEIQGSAGYMRAVLRINVLQRQLAGLPTPASLLLIDSALWTQFDPLAVHAAGPRPGDVVILTSEPVLAAVLEGRLPIGVALERGLLVVDAEPDAAAAVRHRLVAALAREES